MESQRCIRNASDEPNDHEKQADMTSTEGGASTMIERPCTQVMQTLTVQGQSVSPPFLSLNQHLSSEPSR